MASSALSSRLLLILGFYKTVMTSSSASSVTAEEPSPLNDKQPSTTRVWVATLELTLSARPTKTVLTGSRHYGPLRVQRPFYPETNGCCHLYILHPPGGMVIGDELKISATLEPNTHALLTTPSAGKIYGAKGAAQQQCQTIQFKVASGACLEWLPQETIVFDSANGRLKTRIDLEPDARYAGWDIVRLGRIASGETFATGECRQSLEVWQAGIPQFIERNTIQAGGELQLSVWGLQNKNTLGTFIMTVEVDRNVIDQLYESLELMRPAEKEHWGITQKNAFFIARYLGDDVAFCRKGFEYIWQQLRPLFNQQDAVIPRIWNT
ncbi:urease accessory protein UreD [Teredinibacter purpureus]|uniref:urease accessory protein UreD n=1 Tax=Teredinibacter purpureus TaxID=2731756 RepID=UPI000A53476E|nr:urease accessory protein UreD [Teredinibacter purpureus]